MKGNYFLVIGGSASVLISILHVATVIGGAAWYRALGAGEEMASLAEEGSWYPGIITSIIALIFLIWGLYAFSANGLISKLPYVKPVNYLISAVYVLRGMGWVTLFISSAPYSLLFIISTSLVSMAIGLCYFLGIRRTN